MNTLAKAMVTFTLAVMQINQKPEKRSVLERFLSYAYKQLQPEDRLLVDIFNVGNTSGNLPCDLTDASKIDSTIDNNYNSYLELTYLPDTVTERRKAAAAIRDACMRRIAFHPTCIRECTNSTVIRDFLNRLPKNIRGDLATALKGM